MADRRTRRGRRVGRDHGASEARGVGAARRQGARSPGRPFLFRQFNQVQFPLRYELETSDFVTATGLNALEDRCYYIEALYYGFVVDGVRVDRWEGVFGQGWGAPGRPFPLAFGQTRDIQLNAWDSAELAGWVAPPADERWQASGWLWIARDVQDQLRPDQPLEVTLTFCDGNDLEDVGFSTLRVVLPRISDPVHWHSSDPRIHGRSGYLTATATAVDRHGTPCRVVGGRASSKVVISLSTTTIKIVLNRVEA